MATTDSHRILPFPAAGADAAPGAARASEIARAPEALPSAEAALAAPCALLGPSATIARTREQLARVGPHFRAVLLCGPRGCGAEAAARTLHAFSPLAGAPFHLLSRAAAEATLLPAATAQPAAELAGVLYLPEAERLSLQAQRALLRQLRFRGPANLRLVGFVAADLRGLVATGAMLAEFADLLGSVRLQLPPLRERRDDLPVLALALLTRLAARAGVPVPPTDGTFFAALAAHDWPENLPELNNVLRAALEATDSSALVPGATLTGATLTGATLTAALLRVRPAGPVAAPPAENLPLRLDDVIQHHVRRVLLGCGGNKLRAAEALGISRSTLYRMLEQPPAAAVADPLRLAS